MLTGGLRSDGRTTDPIMFSQLTRQQGHVQTEHNQKQLARQVVFCMMDNKLQKMFRIFGRMVRDSQWKAFVRIQNFGQQQQFQRQTAVKAVIQNLKNSLDTVFNSVKNRRRLLLSIGFNSIASQPQERRLMQLSPSIHRDIENRKPENRNPKNSEALMRENTQLKKKREINKQEVQWFSSEMNQLLMRHQHILRKN